MIVTVLTHLMDEASTTSYDVVIDQVVEALQSLKHDVTVLGVHDDPKHLIDGLSQRQPDVVFNLMETFGKTQLGQVAAVGLLDLLGVPYTGCGPGEYYLQEDKAITKKLLAFDDIRFPDFAVFSIDRDLETGGNLRLPLFVKPLRMDASIGIDGKSLVKSTKELWTRVGAIHKLNDSALVEEYIEGREFFVGILGNQTPQAFEPLEVDFSGLPAGSPKVMDAKAKWDKNSRQFKGTKIVFPDLPGETRARLQKAAIGAYRALRVRDYGRVDLRMADTGEIYVIEVNASCYLEQNGEFVMAAQKAGYEYPQLLQRIIDLALERHSARRAPQKV
jgi:D-alanine-D-alanine ligase